MPAEKESSSSSSSSPSSSSAADHRKNSKPIMEKRRRARINASLCELKSLLLEVMKKEGTRHNKMEKADILEMTVKHLRQIQRQQFTAAASTDPSIVNRYQTGFAECAGEVTRYLSSVEGVDVDLKTRMLNHLANSIQGMMAGGNGGAIVGNGGGCVMGNMATVSAPVVTSQPPSHVTVSLAPKAVAPPMVIAGTGEINNNVGNVGSNYGNGAQSGVVGNHGNVNGVLTGTLPSLVIGPTTTSATVTSLVTSTPMMTSASPQKIVGGLQLIPTRLPGGEVAFLLPSNVLPGQVLSNAPGYVIPLYTGNQSPPATTAVTTTTIPTSASPTNAPLQAAVVTSGEAHACDVTSGEQLPPSPAPSASPCASSSGILTSPAPSPEPMNLTSERKTPMTSDPEPSVCTSAPVPLPPSRSPDISPAMVREVKQEVPNVLDLRERPVPAEDESVWRPW